MTKTRNLKQKRGYPKLGSYESQTFRVAIAQFAPVYLDKAASLARALQIVQDAKKRGAELVAFGETWLPGYPAWLDVSPNAALWEHLPTKQVFARLRPNSVTVPGPETAAFCEVAGDLKINVVMGVNEGVEAGPGERNHLQQSAYDYARGRVGESSPQAGANLCGTTGMG
jgi:nitrilase